MELSLRFLARAGNPLTVESKPDQNKFGCFTSSVTLRILFLGENWYGSCARACSYALRRMGHDVMDIDAQTFFPQLRLRSSRAALRVFGGWLQHEYNNAVLKAASNFHPDLLIAFKGSYLQAETLASLKQTGIRLYNYYPDRVALASNAFIEDAIPQYDCFFDTKQSWDNGLSDGPKPKDRMFLPHGYDPDVHRPLRLSQDDINQFGCDVSLIATHSPRKEQMLRDLITIKPNLNLRIWGNQWHEKNQTPALAKYWAGFSIEGSFYSKAIQAARINLAIMGIKPGIEDKTTTRTYEIPACGGFMLHERTDEVLELFEEDKEIVCFGDPTELAEKIEYYLAHPNQRAKIAAAGHVRCVPTYSYDNRMAELVRWHEEHSE